MMPNFETSTLPSTSSAVPEVVDISDSPVPGDNEAPPTSSSPNGLVVKHLRETGSPALPKTPPPVWCHVRYHEKRVALGETFEGRRPLVLVLGRGGGQSAFNVGAIDNEERTEAANKARRHLENGDIVVRDLGDGNVTIRSSIPNVPIYVRSFHLNREVQRDLCDPRCHQIFPGTEILVYKACDVLDGLSHYISKSENGSNPVENGGQSEEARRSSPPSSHENGDIAQDGKDVTKDESQAEHSVPKEENGTSKGTDESMAESSNPENDPSHASSSNGAPQDKNEESCGDQPSAKRPKLEAKMWMDPQVLRELTSFQLALPQAGPVPACYADYDCWIDFHLVNVERYIKAVVLKQN
uniref:MH2 domain-containing protein n=1 Tax=Steinernema glaseri TaxID=37863 RepID=A0A1I8AQB7_9BILA